MGYSKSRCKAAKQSKELKDKKNPTTNVFWKISILFNKVTYIIALNRAIK
jgi:hypothetical protein